MRLIKYQLKYLAKWHNHMLWNHLRGKTICLRCWTGIPPKDICYKGYMLWYLSKLINNVVLRLTK